MKFHIAPGIYGDFRPKKHRNLPKNFQSCKLFHPTGANASPDFSEIYVLYALNLSMQCNMLKFAAVWFINDKFVGTKLWWVIFPPNFRNPLAPKLLVGHKKSRWAQKWYGLALSTCQVWWRSTAARRRERKNGCFLFVCLFFLFVTLMVCVSLGYRCAHCEGYIVAIYRSIFMQFSAF